ncbi:expressed unknown protein [Seminavis robusta]|uniref:Uncharacterized protein n=1 Tax=Seminavis robusta TaxID=568900 RepID=A0A9N8E883_9STRA|nr:expressed unknown protein [Seminavis robusta]|eukprot:Sro652_g181820.1 n/a (392) ;mRNA; r:31628-32803
MESVDVVGGVPSLEEPTPIRADRKEGLFVLRPKDQLLGITVRDGINRDDFRYQERVRDAPFRIGTLVWYVANGVKSRFDWYIPTTILDYNVDDHGQVTSYVLDIPSVRDPRTGQIVRLLNALNGTEHIIQEFEKASPAFLLGRWDMRIPSRPLLLEGKRISRRDQVAECDVVLQDGKDPILWGISYQQLAQIAEHPKFRRGQSKRINGKWTGGGMTMYEVVEEIIKPATAGRGVGYALYLNRKRPLRANFMISHAWGEDYEHFLKALGQLGSQGPFWICATAIYQNDDIESMTIEKQLGSKPQNGPFATVIRETSRMIVVSTPQCEIYCRLWCVYEIFCAVAVNAAIELLYFSATSGISSPVGSLGKAFYSNGLEMANVVIETSQAERGKV